MMRTLIRFFILILSGLLFLVMPDIPAVLACSGGGPLPTTKEFIDGADIVVEGQVEQVDDAHQNGILHVTSYLAGEPGPERIVLSFNHPSRVTAVIEDHFGGGGCYYLAQPLNLGDQIVIFLNRNPDGSYSLAQARGMQFYTFNTPEATQPFPGVPSTDIPTTDQLTKIELTSRIIAANAEPPQPPDTSLPPPLLAPLFITTAYQGKGYLLPVDGSQPVLLSDQDLRYTEALFRSGCSTSDCAATSPNGVDFLTVSGASGNEIITFTNGAIRPGKAFLFSTTSDTVAVWNDDFLEIYAVRYPRLGFEDYEPEIIQRYLLNSGMDYSGLGAWSPDGRLLAFSDSKGLWLWDVFTAGSSARLLIASNAYERAAYAREFSATGRYLAITRGERREYFDLVALTSLPDGLMSPDDRNLLAFDTQADYPAMTLQRLAPYKRYFDNTEYPIRQVQWINNTNYIMASCTSDDLASCTVIDESIGWLSHQLYYKGYRFDYEPVSQSVVVLQDAATISINGEIHDLSKWIDGTIETVQWLPSLFYVQQ